MINPYLENVIEDFDFITEFILTEHKYDFFT